MPAGFGGGLERGACGLLSSPAFLFMLELTNVTLLVYAYCTDSNLKPLKRCSTTIVTNVTIDRCCARQQLLNAWQHESLQRKAVTC